MIYWGELTLTAVRLAQRTQIEAQRKGRGFEKKVSCVGTRSKAGEYWVPGSGADFFSSAVVCCSLSYLLARLITAQNTLSLKKNVMKREITDFISTQNRIDKMFREVYQNILNTDGVANPEKYLKRHPRILFVLKEANEYDGCMRELHLNNNDNVITKYSYWKRTYKRILYVTHGIYNKIFSWDDLPNIDEQGNVGAEFHLDEIGFINLKKECGKSNADINEIWRSYQKTKGIIKRQIDFLRPDIIINCSRIWDFFCDQVGENKIEILGFCQFSICKDYLVINTYHPNARISEKNYVDTILSIVKESGVLS